MYDEAARERFRKASEQYRRLKSSYEIVRGEERVARLHVYQEHVQRIPAAGKLEVVELCRTCAAALQSGKDLAAGKIFVCPVCGNTVLDEVPDPCPICGTAKDRFVEI